MGLKDKGTLLYKTNCTECGSSDANQVYGHEDGTTDTYCFACQAYGFSDTIVKHKQEDDKVEMKDIDSLPSLGIRGVKDAVAGLFGVKVGFSPNDGKTIIKQFYPSTKEGQVVGYNERNVLNKGFLGVGDRKGSLELFGQAIAKRNGYKKLFITEGELDAMSLYQVMVENTPDKYKEYKPSVVSFTRGATAGLKDLINNRAFIDKYEEVTLVLDNDEAGKQAQSEILKTFHHFKVAELPMKDANAMLEAGKGKELYNACMWNAKHVRQGEVVQVDDILIEKALERPQFGISSPWASLDKLTYGIRPHTITVLGAAPKQGKSEFKNQLIHHLAIIHERPVGIFDLEVHPVKTLKQVASKEAKLNFLRPDVEYKDELLKETLGKFKGKLHLYDRSGSRDWADIRVAIEEMYLLDGVREFFLDPLTALISRYSSSEANDKLNEIMTDVADLVNKYPISIFCFSHINGKPKGAKQHEQGAKVLSSEFTGSRSLEKWSNLGLAIERDRSDDCPIEDRNKSKVVILYDRDWGNYGSVDMFYDVNTTEYLEPSNRWGR
jgi:twinkle protein